MNTKMALKSRRIMLGLLVLILLLSSSPVGQAKAAGYVWYTQAECGFRTIIFKFAAQGIYAGQSVRFQLWSYQQNQYGQWVMGSSSPWYYARLDSYGVLTSRVSFNTPPGMTSVASAVQFWDGRIWQTFPMQFALHFNGGSTTENINPWCMVY